MRLLSLIYMHSVMPNAKILQRIDFFPGASIVMVVS